MKTALLAAVVAGNKPAQLAKPEKMCLTYWDASFGAESVIAKLEKTPANGEGLYPSEVAACSACMTALVETRHTLTITGSPCRVLDSSQFDAGSTHRESGDGSTATHADKTYAAFTYTTMEIPEGRLCRHVIKEVSQGGGKEEFLRQYRAGLGAELSEGQKDVQTAKIGTEAWNQKVDLRTRS